ncbi:MAG: carboxypeptidase-like regulatory domain-containing protein [Gemmatimonadetes bacterium]|nr:carboxypeptidase-like regulatory domain-containing protein [Gemmatimonadota bacterium]
MRPRRILLLCTVLVAAASPQRGLGAQGDVPRAPAIAERVVLGTVLRDDGSGAPYVLVVAQESGSTREARALTDARGGFRLALPTPSARWTLRALQVGREPSPGPTLGPFAPGAARESDAGSREPITFRLSGAAVTLPTVSVQGADLCGQRAAGGTVVAAAWEEARKALLSARLRSEAAPGDRDAPLVTEFLEYERELDSDGRTVRHQRTARGTGLTARALRSRDADSLARFGYVVDGADGITTFYAPDADVLLSASFAAAHCVRLEPPTAGEPGLIGVAFRPARAQGAFSDIEGVLWIDRASSELRRLHFRYTALPAAAQPAEPGGEVTFARIASGEWIVHRWHVRMPILDATERAPSIGRRSIVVRATARTLTGVQVTGGEVLRVRRGTATLFETDAAALVVQARSDDPLHTPTGVRATLDGTDDAWRTAADGTLRLAPILPGTYRLAVSSALMDTLGVRVDARVVPVDADGRLVEWRLPDSRQLVDAVCRDAALTGTQALPRTLLRGQVRDARGRAVPRAIVRVRAVRNGEASPGDARVILNDDARRIPTDSTGHWRLCGVPVGERLVVYAAGNAESTTGSGGISAGDTVFTMPDAPLAALDLTLRRPVTAALTLRVLDAQGQPLRDVVAEVEPLGGPTFALRTTSDGRTPVQELPRGTATVRLRRVGYQEGTVTVELADGHNEVPVGLDPVSAPSLDTVRVVALRERNVRHSEFHTRRARGLASASFSREDIEKRNPVSAWQMLSRVGSILIVDSLGSYYAKSTRERTLDCWMRVAIDGRVMPDARFNLALLPAPGEIEGIEVFAGPATIPLGLSSQGSNSVGLWGGGESTRTFCGLIAIWTR